MVSLRLLFSSFPHPPRRPRKPNSSKPTFHGALAAAAAVGVGVGLAFSLKMANPAGHFASTPPHGGSPIWASLSLSDSGAGTSVDPKTGMEFPNVVDGARRLLGIGIRKKNLLGLKNIDVYAFGVYADENDVKSLKQKYGTLTVSQLKESKEFHADVLEQDLCMTVRLQIVYSRLSIRSVRSAFEESVGSRLQKYSGSDNRELLQSFTSLFKDEYKIPRGSMIDLSREHGYVLRTRIDGKEVGSIESKLLCQSILDLYIGDDPFDRRAKEEIVSGLALLLQN